MKQLSRDLLVDANTTPPTDERVKYLVLTENNEQVVSHFNDYSNVFSGAKDCWQTMGGDDFPLKNTKYIPLVLEPETEEEGA